MARFNTARQSPQSPIKTTGPGRTFEGGQGFTRDSKGELFLLAVSNMVGTDTFYESASVRDGRYQKLVHTVAAADPQWTAQFLAWLRGDGNMRSASLVGALEAARAMVAAKIPGARQIVSSVLQRADEPGEALAYWTSRYGRAVPKPVKRGIADAVARLYGQYSLLKYDTASKGFRFGDVIELVHPAPLTPEQGHLFRYAIERRHGRGVADGLPTISYNETLRQLAALNANVLLSSTALSAAGFTWEDALSLAGSRVDKAELWRSMIPSMGYMALLRNLRNFDEAGIGAQASAWVAAKLADPWEVKRSRQFPFRFLAAYENAPSLFWGPHLEKALEFSLANLPELPGRSLILVDTSGSMTGSWGKSTVSPVKAASVFGVALAVRNAGRVDLHGFATGVFRHDVVRGASTLREIDRFIGRVGEAGHGTNIHDALASTYSGHDRVFIISDMQTTDAAGPERVLPARVPLYGFNLGGYGVTAFEFGQDNRHEFGGLTDATFRMVPLLEAGRDGVWPWVG